MSQRVLRNVYKQHRPSMVHTWHAAIMFFAMALPAYAATTLQFYSITNNNAPNSTAGANQLFVEVSDPAGANNVLFRFGNLGPIASSITDVYFDDGTLLAIAGITNGTGVSFSQGAAPPNLPGANNATPPFNVTAGFSADSNPPVSQNGVNPGENLSVLFSLQSGQEYATVITSLQTGALRVGMHVQSFPNGGSESFVNLPVATIPEPSTLAFWVAGALLLLSLGKHLSSKSD